jgi:hypothetical protein
MSGGNAGNRVSAVWGVGGVMLIFSMAVYRLWPYVAQTEWTRLSLPQQGVLLLLLLFFVFGKGVGVLHRKYVPRVAERAALLADEGGGLRHWLAPLFCMGFFGAPPRRVVAAFGTVLGIVLLIVGVRHLDSPWRGMVDLSVISGLAVGIVSLGVRLFRMAVPQRK